MTSGQAWSVQRVTDAMAVRPTSLLGISTSLKPGERGGSAARSILCHALERVGPVTGDVFLLDLRDHPLPLFDGRLPDAYGSPSVQRVVTAVRHAGALLLSVPAYWTGVSGVFKNLIDVLCGPAYDLEPPYETVFSGKPVGLLVVGADDASAIAGASQAVATMRSTGAVVTDDVVAIGNVRTHRADLEPVVNRLVLQAAELARVAVMRPSPASP